MTPEIFPDGVSNSIASAMVIWEGCNLLAQRHTLPWNTTPDGKLLYSKPVKGGKGFLNFGLTEPGGTEESCQCLTEAAASEILDSLELRATCLHLIYAAYATTLERPWEQEFTLSDRTIAAYLGLNKRKDLSRRDKLDLIQTLVRQPSQIVVAIDWPKQGRIEGFCLPEERLWHLTAIEPKFLQHKNKPPEVSELRFTLKAGEWSRYFLNAQGYRDKTAFYQYTTLPKFVLESVMSHWQHHEGAVRMLLWLFFKIRLGKQQTIAVQTLMKIAYGEAKMRAASSDRTKRKRQIRTFERDLEVLFEWGFRCQFDPVTYPPDIQPLWWKLKVVPDEGEAALEFWREDALKERSILDPAPRGKWKRLLNARFLGIDLDQDMAQHLTPVKHPKRDRSRKATPTLTGEQIKAARQCQKLSQRELARLMGKSQSWMRDIENGRLNIKPADRKRLQKILFRNS